MSEVCDEHFARNVVEVPVVGSPSGTERARCEHAREVMMRAVLIQKHGAERK